jgi:hypothetical protein
MVIYRKIKQKDKVRPAWWFFLVSIVIGQIAFYMITHTFEQQSSGGYRLEPQLEHPLDSTKNH